jgi:hypothetical protein
VKRVLICLLLIWTTEGFSVSRVGGGKVRSNSSGFELSTPRDFAQIRPLNDEALRVMGPVVATITTGFIQQYVEVSEFRNEFADATQLSATDLKKRFTAQKWTDHKSHTGCVVLLKSSQNGVFAWIATWGQGKGVVLKGLALPDIDNAMTAMIQSLSLDEGACAWK